MTWVTRFGNVAKSAVLIVLELAAIFTEALKIFAEHLDAAVDDLNTKVSPPAP